MESPGVVNPLWVGCRMADHLILFFSPVPVVGKGEEEEEEDGMGLCLPATPKNCLPRRRGISILEKLIKTCPVWLQLSLGQAEVARILHRVVAGVSGAVSHW